MTMHIKKGFTLIELLVVSSIIAILASVGIVSYQKATQISRDAKRKTDLEQIRQALETYRSENGTYPYSTVAGIEIDGNAIFAGYLAPAYMAAVPKDPKSDAASGATKYNFYKTGNINEYSLCAELEIDPGQTLNRCLGKLCGTGAGTCNYEVTNP